MPDEGLTFHILGPLVVRRDGEELHIGGPRPRAVLAHLVLRAGRVMSADELLEEVWHGDVPTTGTGPLRTYISQLRRLLHTGPPGSATSALVRRPSGYLLDIASDQVDATRFERRFAEARAAVAATAPSRALAHLDAALALWRGPALVDLAGVGLAAETGRLDQLRLSAQELQAELQLATGQHAHATAELAVLARAHPTREHLWALLMTALYRSGRQSEALRCYQDARAELIGQVGVEPGAELRALESAILRQDPALDWRPGADRTAPGGRARGAEAGAGRGRSGADGGGRHNLPHHLTSFLGRAAERSAAGRALGKGRLVSLCGPAGCGKTRLAVVVAEDLLDVFPAGVWFVDLSAVADPAHVPRAISASLGADSDEPHPLDHLCRVIGDDEMLVVLDNCEHVVEAAAEVAEAVLGRCPSARILATSREELLVGPETVLRIGALALPEPGAAGQSTEAILRSDAVQLFIERGRAALADFDPTPGTLEVIAGICRRLDGIPLAIELAAALVGSLPLGEISDRLDDRFRLLGAPARRGVTPRQRTLGAALDWSFDLLDRPERELFVRLGVFMGDFTLSAAESVAAGDDPMAVVRGLSHLVTKSMVTCVAGGDGANRYRLLETVRQYARERLDQDELASEVRRRHARHYADFVVEAERHVHGPAASAWLARVVSELPNLRVALAWAFSAGELDTALRLAGSLSWFFARMGLLDEAERWLGEGVRRRTELPLDLRVRAMTAACTVAFMRGEFRDTREMGEECVAVARELGDDQQVATALIVRGGAAVYEGELTRAEECLGEAEALCTRLGDRWGLAWMLTVRSVGSRRAGHHQASRRQLEDALAIFRDLGDEHGQVLPLVNLAVIAQDEVRLDDALVMARQAALLAVHLADRQLQHTAMCVLGRVEQSLGEPEIARELLVRCIADFPGAHHRMMVAIAVEGLAGLAGGRDDHAAAALLLGFAGHLREVWQIGVSPPRARELDAWLADARRALGDERADHEVDRGRGLGLDEVLAVAEEATAELALDVPSRQLITGRLLAGT